MPTICTSSCGAQARPQSHSKRHKPLHLPEAEIIGLHLNAFLATAVHFSLAALQQYIHDACTPSEGLIMMYAPPQ